MTAAALVSRLETMGCVLWAENGRVQFHDPARALTPKVLETLQNAKAEVLRVVEGKSKPHLLHAPGTVSEPRAEDADLIEAGRLADREVEVFAALGYTYGDTEPSDWVPEQSVIAAVPGSSAQETLELLACLETAGRARCLRRYPAQRLWRALPPKGTTVFISGPVEGYGKQMDGDFTEWELNA